MINQINCKIIKVPNRCLRLQTRMKYSLTETRTSSVETVSSSQLNMLNFIVTRFRFFRRVLELRLMPESLLSWCSRNLDGGSSAVVGLYSIKKRVISYIILRIEIRNP